MFEVTILHSGLFFSPPWSPAYLPLKRRFFTFLLRWGKQDKVELRVFAGTWNLGNAAPPNDLRVPWMRSNNDRNARGAILQVNGGH